MATESHPPRIFWEEKISIEPDLGDQRRSVYKALPSPPKTPKRVMMKYRFSSVLPLVLSIATFIPTLMVVLAGHNVGIFEGQYLVALNTSQAGRDIITLEKTSATSGVPSATSPSASATSSPLNPANSDRPLSGLGDTLGSLSGNLTDAVNDGPGDAVTAMVEGVINQTGIKDFYYVYVQKVCYGIVARGDDGSADGVNVDDCRSWEEARDSISALGKRVRSSVVIGQTRVSTPLLGKLMSSLDSILVYLDAVRKAAVASLIITLVGSILSTISMLPAMYFPQSRLLIYFNMSWSALATLFAFIAAMLLSAMVVLAGMVDDFSSMVGVQARRGAMALLFVWLSFVFMSLVTVYWVSVWFVETRKLSFIRRRRDEDEIGHWGGICREILRDLKGRRRTPRMRAGI